MSTETHLECCPPSESSCRGLGIRRQLSGPGGSRSGIPSLSSSSSHSSPFPSLSVSSWELLMTAGQLSLESWCPSPSLDAIAFHVQMLVKDEHHWSVRVMWLMKMQNTCPCWCHRDLQSDHCLCPSEKQLLFRTECYCENQEDNSGKVLWSVGFASMFWCKSYLFIHLFFFFNISVLFWNPFSFAS